MPPFATGRYDAIMKDISQREDCRASAALMAAVERDEAFRMAHHGTFVSSTEVKAAFAHLPASEFVCLRADADAVLGEDRDRA